MRGERLNDGLSIATTGDGANLIFLPGLGGGADLSLRVPRTAALSARAIAHGTGRTVHLINRPVNMRAGTSIAELAEWHAVALHKRFGEPVDVMGTSGGGLTALQLAIDHPEVVHRLVLSVAASRVSDRGQRELLRIVELEQQQKSAAWVSSGLVAHGLLRPITAVTYALGGRAQRASGETALIQAVQRWDVTARLYQITAPTLVIAGTRDRLIPPELARATAHGMPNARLLLLQGRGHATTLFDPRATKSVTAFLDEPSH